MINGLKLTFSGAELRKLLKERIADHRRHAHRWTLEESRTPEEETEDAPLLPDHICANAAERHVWRAEVLQFIRDHVEAAGTYRLSPSDLELGELLPSKPGWLEQDEYEERTGVAFMLERLTKAVDGLAAAGHRALWSDETEPEPEPEPGPSQRLDQAPIDHEVGPRDIPRPSAGEKQHEIGDFVGAREPSRREASL